MTRRSRSKWRHLLLLLQLRRGIMGRRGGGRRFGMGPGRRRHGGWKQMQMISCDGGPLVKRSMAASIGKTDGGAAFARCDGFDESGCTHLLYSGMQYVCLCLKFSRKGRLLNPDDVRTRSFRDLFAVTSSLADFPCVGPEQNRPTRIGTTSRVTLPLQRLTLQILEARASASTRSHDNTRKEKKNTEEVWTKRRDKWS
jgi:hypothetical protein